MPSPERTSANTPPFVLVHGALHGGWCWRRTARLLREAGAEVFTPTLTGVGERAHLNGPHIGLDTHIQDVVNCIECEELDRVVLVGHSYAGMVITAAAQWFGERIADLVYLDGVVPRDGESALDAMGNLTVEEAPMFEARSVAGFGVEDPADMAWLQRRLTKQSLKTLRQKLSVKRELPAVHRTYIACTADRGTGSYADKARQVALTRIDASWRYHEIAAGHDAMITAPNEVARILLAVAAETSARGRSIP
jgi:pimeloyl-ACP methyl ester carboxylesterase